MIYCKRVYDEASPDDGKRVLVDRLWPRGIRKANLKMDEWCKEASPSTPLRQWYHQDMSQQDEFRARYTAELAAYPEHCAPLLAYARAGDLTLLYGARDPVFNHALVLADYLRSQLQQS